MPAIGISRTHLIHQFGMDHGHGGHGHTHIGNGTSERCECCPYGYHIDLDFVPFTKKMLTREGDFERLKELKDKWRSDRQSMDKLLGVDISTPKVWDLKSSSRTRSEVWRKEDISWEQPPVPRRRSSSGLLTEAVGLGLRTNSELILENGLSEAVTDFESVLQRTRPQSKVLSYEIPDSCKFHTFPRIKGPALKEIARVGGENLTVSSIFSTRGSSTTTSASTIIMRERPTSREIIKRSAESLDLLSESPTYSRLLEDEERAMLLKQVKLIPDLENKIMEMNAQKQELSELLEMERSKVRDLTAKFEGMSKPYKGPTREFGVQKGVLTRDVGVTYVGARTRTIAVGSNLEMSTWDRDRSSRGDSTSPTGSLSGTLRRRVKTFDAGCQVKDYDFPDSDTSLHSPLLQIVEGIEFGVQVGPSLGEVEAENDRLANENVLKAPPRKKHAGIMVKPNTHDVGLSFRPSLKDSGSATDVEPPKPMKPRMKHVGVSAMFETTQDTEKEVSPTKPTRAVGMNTDRLRTVNRGCDTTVFDELLPPRIISSSSQTDLEMFVDSETASPPSPPITPTSSASTSKGKVVPTIVSAPILGKSPPEKGQSRIPRLSQGSTTSTRVSKSLPNAGTESPVPSPSTSPTPADSNTAPHRMPQFQRSDTYTKEMYDRPPFGMLEPLEEEERSPASSTASFPPQPEREKISPSREMQAALKVLNDALLRGQTTQNVTNAISIILHEWFRVAGTKTANPYDVEDYLDSFEIYSPQLLRYIVNMPDGNGNTALHYAVSHGNFDVVSILLDSRVCDPNRANKAGYTSIMLVALATITCEPHRQVVRRLFSMGDVNIAATQHGQTALMLGASHGRLDTVKLLLEAGAAINLQDEDGSTALMCAAEHGHIKIVKYLISHSECDLNITDNDGSTAFTIAMEGQHKDIGVLLYARMHFSGPSRSNSTSSRSRNSSNSSSAHTSPVATKKPLESLLKEEEEDEA